MTEYTLQSGHNSVLLNHHKPIKSGRLKKLNTVVAATVKAVISRSPPNFSTNNVVFTAAGMEDCTNSTDSRSPCTPNIHRVNAERNGTKSTLEVIASHTSLRMSPEILTVRN